MPKKPKFDYFDAFCEQSEAARQQAHALLEMLEDYGRVDEDGWMKGCLTRMHEIENGADEVCHGIMDSLAVEFIPPIDREDVTELVLHLDDVTDQIEEVAQHLYMYNIKELHPLAVKFAHVIVDSTEALHEATIMFREFKKPKKLDGLLVAVHDKESEGDSIYIEAKHSLFSDHVDAPASYLIAWNGMFSHMENCCDECESVASTMQKIVLKNA